MALVDSNILARLENNLLVSRGIRDGYSATWFNVAILVFIAVCAGVFLYVQYKNTLFVEAKRAEVKNIPSTQYVWNNAVRNSIELG